MSRPFRSLWPCLWRRFLPLILLYALFVTYQVGSFVHASAGGRSSWRGDIALAPDLLISLPGVTTVAFLLGWRYRWLWRLGRCVRCFHTAAHAPIILHYAPELEDGWDPSVLLERCREEVDLLARQCGAPLRGTVVIFLFARWTDIAHVFGPHYGGTALAEANAILIADDGDVQRSMRHELAHLFTARWSRFAPPLLTEGLAVWWEWTVRDRSLDDAARPFVRNRELRLPLLLKRHFFFAEPQRRGCYLLAGSFTGFLIRRYGWQRYRKLYRLCDGMRFRARFRDCFGVSLEEAESQWLGRLS